MFIYSWFMKIIAVLCTSVLFFPSAIHEKYSPKDADSIRLNAVMMSDWNIESNNWDLFKEYGKMLNGISSSKEKVDALICAGDSTAAGKGSEWFDFYGIFCRFNKADNVLFALGNNDLGYSTSHSIYETNSARAIKNYNTYMNEHIENVYYSKDINGYKFIVLGSEDNFDSNIEYITDGQIEWLKAELSKAAADGKPAFVINHNMIYGKNGTASKKLSNVTSNNDKLNDALVSCGTDVVYICGHAHRGITEDSVNTEGRVTYVNLPAGGCNNAGAEGIYNAKMNGCVMEVYDGSIVLRFRSFGTNQWIEGYDNIVIPIG